MQCEDIRDRLIDVSSADLASQDPQVRIHLEACGECRELLRRTNRAWTMLADIPDGEPDSRAMRTRFASIMTRHQRRQGFVFPWRPAYGVAAVVFALAAGTWIGRQFPAADPIDGTDFVAMRDELREVREMLTLSLLHQTVASERIKGVSSVARMDDPPADVVGALIDTLMHDPSVNVRLACVRALERFSMQPAVRAGVTQAVASENSPLVSIALIDFIVEAMDDMAVETLRRLSQDVERDKAVRDSAARAADRLETGGRL